MATSDRRLPGWLESWVGSRRNIVGAGAALLALLAHVLVGLGPLWPAIVAAAYAVGAIAAPREPVQLRLASGEGASAEDVRDQLSVLRRTVRSQSRRLPAGANELLEAILSSLGEVADRWDSFQNAPDQAVVAERMVFDYVPTTLQSFLNLPRNVASRSTGGARTVDEEFVSQLALLQTEAAKLRDAVYEDDMQALDDQGRFLRDKFSRSELDLGSGDEPGRTQSP